MNVECPTRLQWRKIGTDEDKSDILHIFMYVHVIIMTWPKIIYLKKFKTRQPYKFSARQNLFFLILLLAPSLRCRLCTLSCINKNASLSNIRRFIFRCQKNILDDINLVQHFYMLAANARVRTHRSEHSYLSIFYTKFTYYHVFCPAYLLL